MDPSMRMSRGEAMVLGYAVVPLDHADIKASKVGKALRWWCSRVRDLAFEPTYTPGFHFHHGPLKLNLKGGTSDEPSVDGDASHQVRA